MESSSNKFYYVQGKDLNSSNSYCAQRPGLMTPRKLTKMTGCLEIIHGQDFGQSKSSQDSQCNNHASDTFSRPGSGSGLSRTDSSMSRHTPTKQISLQAVRRKVESAEPFVDQVDWQSLGLKSNNRKIWELGMNEAGVASSTLEHKEIFQLESVDDTFQHATQHSLLKSSTPERDNTPQREQSSHINSMKVNHRKEMSSEMKNKNEKNGSDDENDDDSDDGDDDSDSSDEEEEKLKAPNELLMEFVDCIMRKDFQVASKLCKMILLYEPENPEALKFQPLIEEKLSLDAEGEREAADDSDDGNDDEDSGSSEDDDDDSDSSEEDDDDSEESSDEDDSSSSNDEGSSTGNNKSK